MAITKTEKIDKIEIFMHLGVPTINVVKSIFLDDPDDDQLPVVTQKQFLLEKSKAVVDADGNQTQIDTDIESLESPVKEICQLMWV